MNDVTSKHRGELRRYRTGLVPGPLSDASELERLLSACWDAFVGDDGGMTCKKLLGRMEKVVWEPPKIVFRIERHGATVMGSSRAEVQEWTIDLRTKTLRTVGRRQVRPMQGCFDVQPVADEIAAAILAGRLDDRLKWDGKPPARAGVAEQEQLADLVGKSDLCSRLFPLFIHSYQDHTGHEPTGAVKRIAARIEEIDRMGLHCTPQVVARVLRECVRASAASPKK